MLFHIDFLTYFACSFISDKQHNVFIYISLSIMPYVTSVRRLFSLLLRKLNL